MNPSLSLESYPIPLTWEPELGYVILLPSKLPNVTEHGLILPESVTRKENAGLCVRISAHGLDEGYKRLLGQECFFPLNNEYRIKDTDTDTLYYVIRADQIIFTRIPPKTSKFVQVLSREEGGDEEKPKK